MLAYPHTIDDGLYLTLLMKAYPHTIDAAYPHTWW